MLDTIKGELRVFTKEVTRPNGEVRVLFNASIGSTKLEDDSYLNYYIGLSFSSEVKKQVAKVYQQESFDMLIKDAWFKAYADKNGNTKPMLFINKATIVSKDEKPVEAPKKSKVKAKTKTDADLEPIDDDNLPF